jgi:hypothetical protein
MAIHYGLSNGPPLGGPDPSRILSLNNWKLQIPVATKGLDQPGEVKWPQLQRYESQFFHLNPADNGVVFWVNAGGAIIPGSIFPRTELREMTDGGSRQASWSDTNGTHTMTIREAITHLPAAHPAIVAGQIHDAENYLALIRLDGTRLWVKADNKSAGVLDENYRLGTVFTVKLVATGGHILVYYNGALKVNFAQTSETCYFKAGAYLQSNTGYGDSPDAYGEVVIYALQASYSS